MKYIYTLNELISSLKNIEQAKTRLERYVGHDWMFKLDRVEEGVYKKISIHNSDIFDVYLIVWGKNSETAYHDHAEYGCIMKILKGELNEERKDITNNIQISNLNKGEISMIKNRDGIHKISNSTVCDLSVSLHIYFPGNYRTNYYSNDSVVVGGREVRVGVDVGVGEDVVFINSTCSGGGATVDSEPII